MNITCTALEAEAKYGIPAKRTYLWKHAGKVAPVTGPGRPALFPLDRLQALNDAANAHPRATLNA